MWDLNNLFVAMTHEPYHFSMRGVVAIHHQETPRTFLEVDSELKGYLLPRKEDNMCANEQSLHHQALRAQTERPVPQKLGCQFPF